MEVRLLQPGDDERRVDPEEELAHLRCRDGRDGDRHQRGNADLVEQKLDGEQDAADRCAVSAVCFAAVGI